MGTAPRKNLRTWCLAPVALCCAAVASAQTVPSTLPTSGDLETIRTRLLASVVPPGQTDIEALITQARPHAGTLQPDGSWADIAYTDTNRASWRAVEHLYRAMLLAKGFYLSHDAALADASATALRWWIDKNPQNSNWWWNDIGVPQLLSETYLLLGDRAPNDRLPALNVILARKNWLAMTGQNTIWMTSNQVLRGLINADTGLVANAYAHLYNEIKITTDEGIQPDGSFHQHGPQFYSGGYGLSFSQDATRFTAYALGTRCSIPKEKFDILSEFLLNGEAWMTWGPLVDFSSIGREIVREGKLATTPNWSGPPITPVGRAYSLGNVIHSLSQLPLEVLGGRQQAFEAWAANLLDPAAPRVNLGHKYFPYSDYTAHRRANYFASVKFYSSRIRNTESGNGEGKVNHHLGDGNLFLYLSDNEYTDIFPCWDWQRLPGITAEIVPDLAKTKAFPLSSVGKEPFVGGVSDGVYGASTTHLAKGELTARKSYFFFDDEIVCLGSAIACPTSNDVVTTVNQCYLQGEVTKGERWFHNGQMGYVVLDPQKYEMFAGPRTGRWTTLTDAGSPREVTLPIFQLCCSHGSQPQNGTYAYALLPGLSAKQTADRAAHPETEVVSNTGDIQAVWNKRLAVTMAVFHTAGEAAGIAVDHPCVVMLRGNALSAANPTNQPLTLSVTLKNRGKYTLELDKGLTTTVTVDAEH